MNKPQVLSHVQFEHIMKRFPSFELSYETVSHKKVSSVYNTGFAIPQGKKCFAWFTFLGEQDVCFIFDLSRDKKIVKAYQYSVEFKQPLALGTVFYGTFLEEEKPFFVIEDLFYFKGIAMKHCNTHQKLEFAKDALDMLTRSFSNKNQLVFSLPVFWEVMEKEDYELSCIIPSSVINNIGYTVHHLQYRCLYDTMPYLNVQLARPKLISAPIVRKAEATEQHITTYVSDFTKSRYKEPVSFMIRADIQFDIYHLYAWSYKLSKQVYYGVACIPNYKTSVMMNGMFRKIRENANLDFIEESDDEEDFQNNAEDKYVDLEKKINMICTFHWKFKKWVPVRVSEPRAKLVVIEELSKDSNQRPMNNNRRPDNHQQQNMYSRHPRNQGLPNRPPFKKIYA